jgi:hypothetical protein
MARKGVARGPRCGVTSRGVHVAAVFSEARGEANVQLHPTPRRYPTKPRGSAPGLVVGEREKILVLQVAPARIERLFTTEER